MDTAKVMHHIAGFRGRKYRYLKSDDASYWTLSCSNSFKDCFNWSIAVCKRVSDVHHWISKEILLMVSLLFYKPKGKLIFTRWGYYTFWQREALFTKESNSDYHFKVRWRKTSGKLSGKLTSGNNDGKNGNITILNISEEC